jgi:hypothetical protein
MPVSIMQRQQLFHLAYCFVLTFGLSAPVYAQGSGDLPPVTKGKPAPTPRGRTAPKSNTAANPNPPAESKPATLTRRPANVPPLVFNQPVVASLEGQGPGRLATGHYYNEFTLSAKASDLLSIQFQPDLPVLVLRVYNAARAELPIVKDSATGEYRFDTPTGTVPADGQYQVRVLNLSEEKKPEGAYRLLFNRTGMTEAAYEAQLRQIAEGFKASEAASVEATVKQLEELIASDATKPGAFELLGVIYLNHKNDSAKAASQMEQAIKLGGAGVFKVSYDSQWRRPKRSSAGFLWEDVKTGWLRIQAGKVALADVANPNQINSALAGALVNKVERLPVLPVVTVQVLPRRLLQFSPVSKNGAEADLIVTLLQNYVVKKTK